MRRKLLGIVCLLLPLGCDPPDVVTVALAGPGPTPFIHFLALSGPSLGKVSAVEFVIAPRPGSVSKPVDVTYGIGALKAQGRVTASAIRFPVFGLYASAQNQLTVRVQFSDGSSQTLPVQISTPAYVDPAEIYDHPTIRHPRAPGSVLGFDFFALKSAVDPVTIVDTDGAIRWVGTGMPSMSLAFRDNGFVIGSPSSGALQQVGLDGTVTSAALFDPTATDFTHNIDPGKRGVLAELDVAGSADATLEEIDGAGASLQRWSLADLLGAYMSSRGDDPGQFVRPGIDWFHLNAATYDPRDDTVIVSSRENFVVKLDYATGEPVWILGDPTKYWYTFPSLRAKALQLAPGSLAPIGQHATSITSDGLLMLFNDGYPSVNMPAGEPAGAARPYAAVSAYAIDPVTMTAEEVWRFDDGQSIDSTICSSAYEGRDRSVLVDFAFADAGTSARLLGLDASHQVVFDFEYANHGGCNTAWNAVPVGLDQLEIR